MVKPRTQNIRNPQINGKNTKLYSRWNSMIMRCYKRSDYVDCTASEEFLNFQTFAKWCDDQEGFHLGYEMDKDILHPGNKVYSRETCIFVPPYINKLFVKNSKGGKYPIGVQKNKNKFSAHMTNKDESAYIGTYDTPELAFMAYKEVKERKMKEVAEYYKDKIDPRIYKAMIEYVVKP